MSAAARKAMDLRQKVVAVRRQVNLNDTATSPQVVHKPQRLAERQAAGSMIQQASMSSRQACPKEEVFWTRPAAAAKTWICYGVTVLGTVDQNGHVVVRKALLVHPRVRITRSSATRESCGERQQEYVPVCLCSSGLKFLFNSETTVRGVLAYAS